MVPSFAGMKTIRLTFLRALGAVLALAIVAYLGAIAWLVTHETQLIFEPGASLGDRRPAQPFQQVEEGPAEGGAPSARAWLMPNAVSPETRPWLIFLHGNNSTTGSAFNLLHCERLRELGLNVLEPEYRGYAGLGGTPTEPGVDQDARHWYDYLRRTRHVDPQRIVIYGWSLGSAVAVNLASHVDEAAVVLEGAPASIVAIGEQRYPIFPIRLLIHNPFESILRIGAIHAPKLFLHSPADVVVPIAEGRKLFAAAAAPKQFVEVAGGHVHASDTDPRFFPAIQTFLRAQHLLP